MTSTLLLIGVLPLSLTVISACRSRIVLSSPHGCSQLVSEDLRSTFVMALYCASDSPTKSRPRSDGARTGFPRRLTSNVARPACTATQSLTTRPGDCAHSGEAAAQTIAGRH